MSLEPLQLEEARGGERAAAETASARLAGLAASNGSVTVQLGGSRTEVVELPAPAVRLLVRCLVELGHSKVVGVISLGSELSTQQVADLLGVSRPFVVKEIEEGRLPARRVGARRRVAVEELVAYRARVEHASQDALGRLSDLDERLGLVAAPDGARDTISTPEDRKSHDA